MFRETHFFVFCECSFFFNFWTGQVLSFSIVWWIFCRWKKLNSAPPSIQFKIWWLRTLDQIVESEKPPQWTLFSIFLIENRDVSLEECGLLHDRSLFHTSIFTETLEQSQNKMCQRSQGRIVDNFKGFLFFVRFVSFFRKQQLGT